jgi:hypothetical protein
MGASVRTDDMTAVEAFVRIRLADQVAPALFETWLRDRAAVRGVWSLSGDCDYEIRLATGSLNDLTAELRAMRRQGAEQTNTCLLLRDVLTDRSPH